jgi:predicted molibdopterin-dependent oxidoreductase YjgC
MDNIRFDLSWPPMEVDALHKHLVIDHNRCILCGRCIRTCDEIVGSHTLDFGNRGWKDMVCADLNQPLGQSSCISCGACFQVCPTGAISAKSGTYRGKPEEFSTIESACTICGLGCSIQASVKNNKVVRIDSPDLTAPGGILCYKGRFEQTYDRKNRITKPVMKKNGKFAACTFDQAIDEIAAKLADSKSKHGNDSIAGLATSQLSNEALKLFSH